MLLLRVPVPPRMDIKSERESRGRQSRESEKRERKTDLKPEDEEW